MARCIYCGKSAGFLKKMHEECDKRHESAMSLIPGFLPKFFESNLPHERFRQLLEDAAKASFIKPEELKNLIASGISNMIDGILDQRLPSESDVQRISKIADELAPIVQDDILPYEALTKIDILRELEKGSIPNLISIAEPLPIEIGRGETVIWIFNHVISYRDRGSESDTKQTGVELLRGNLPFYKLEAFKQFPAPLETLREHAQGDLIVTNRRLLFLIDDVRCEKIPVVRISSLRAYANGIQITNEQAAQRTRTFIVNDAWFAANFLVRLIWLIRRRRADSGVTSAVEVASVDHSIENDH